MIHGVYFQICEINILNLAHPKNRMHAQWTEGNRNKIASLLAEALQILAMQGNQDTGRDLE